MESPFPFSCFLVIFWSVLSGSENVQCPEYCDCNVFENLNRATCRDRNLIQLELGIPKDVQILDISQNYIRELRDKTFLEQGFTELKLLNMSDNKLSHIHFNAFEGMQNLKTLDFSYNAIEYFLENWFVSLSSLEELYLRGNNLKSINKQPLIDIETLKMLDLSSCHIIHINNNLFSLLPNLWYLDISNNYLTNLKVDIIAPLKKLTQFKVANNQFSCRDRNFNEIETYTVKNNISYVNPCRLTKPELNINGKSVKFQKLMVTNKDFEKSTTEKIEKNNWLKIEPQNTHNITTTDAIPPPPPKSLFMHIVETSPWLLITLAFFYGIFIGIILTCCANLLFTKLSRPRRNFPDDIYSEPVYANMSTLENPSRRQNIPGSITKLLNLNKLRQTERSSNNSDDDTLMMNEFIPNSTPMQLRKGYE